MSAVFSVSLRHLVLHDLLSFESAIMMHSVSEDREDDIERHFVSNHERSSLMVPRDAT